MLPALLGQAAGCQGSLRDSRQLSGLPSYQDRTGQVSILCALAALLLTEGHKTF